MDHNWWSDIHFDISWFTLVLRSKSILLHNVKVESEQKRELRCLIDDNSVNIFLG